MDSINDRAGSFIKATIRTKTGFVYKNPEPLMFEIQNEKIMDNFHRHVIPLSYKRMRRKLISDVASQYKKQTITISERRDN